MHAMHTLTKTFSVEIKKMPGRTNVGPRSWANIDASTANSLYWKAVPAVLRLADRGEQESELTVRILSGKSPGNHESRV